MRVRSYRDYDSTLTTRSDAMKTMPRLKRLTTVFALASMFAFSANAFAAVYEESPGSMAPGTPLRGAPMSQARGPMFTPFAQSPAHVAATVTSIASGAWSNPATWDTEFQARPMTSPSGPAPQ